MMQNGGTTGVLASHLLADEVVDPVQWYGRGQHRIGLERMRAFWVAMIELAVSDVVDGYSRKAAKRTGGTSQPTPYDADCARDWIFAADGCVYELDFEAVCEAIDLDPEAIRARLRPYVRRHPVRKAHTARIVSLHARRVDA